MKWIDIVFMSGDDADEAMSILDEYGENALLQHLAQWDNADGGGFVRDFSPTGESDTVVQKDGYELAYNTRLGYCGLCKLETDES